MSLLLNDGPIVAERERAGGRSRPIAFPWTLECKWHSVRGCLSFNTVKANVFAPGTHVCTYGQMSGGGAREQSAKAAAGQNCQTQQIVLVHLFSSEEWKCGQNYRIVGCQRSLISR